ncbi:MAG: hypothetical protein KGO02_00240 [Alphaproteobacteria bacterium]|nr:hypothetical protein [Alphaproteobacteria bacterium]
MSRLTTALCRRDAGKLWAKLERFAEVIARATHTLKPAVVLRRVDLIFSRMLIVIVEVAIWAPVEIVDARIAGYVVGVVLSQEFNGGPTALLKGTSSVP